MQKIKFQIIISLVSFALAGIILTQMYWVRNAIILKEEQFNHGVRVALKSVVNRMLLDYHERDKAVSCPEMSALAHNDTLFFQVISPETLERYIREEMSCFGFNAKYFYGIYNKDKQALLVSNAEDQKEKILSSLHAVSLSCIFSHDPYYLGIYIEGQKSYILMQMITGLVLSALFMLAVVTGFVVIVMGWFRQKKLSEMKNDFVNNMTHEFQTPIATISIASEMLLKEDVRELPGRTEKYAQIIRDENLRLQGLVEQVLQIAVLDAGEHHLHISNLDVHMILTDLQQGFGITAREKGGIIKACLEAKNSMIYADPTHFTNIMANLLDNAIKYSDGSPEITITTADYKDGILISFKDKGIGIARENIPYVFQKLYRVHTGKIHNVKGFGLGLYYVKRMVEAHRGNVWVESEAGKGSRFFAYFPNTPFSTAQV